MATKTQPFSIEFPPGYDAQAEFEVSYRGYLSDVTVHLEDGKRHRLTFMDPSRLQQDLADNVEMGRAYVAEPGLVILPEVSTEAIRRAVQGLWDDGYFRRAEANEVM